MGSWKDGSVEFGSSSPVISTPAVSAWGGCRWIRSLTSRSASWNGKAYVQGETLPEKYGGNVLRKTSHVGLWPPQAHPARAPLHTHPTSCIHTNNQIYPPMCHMSKLHNSLAFALCTWSCHCTHQLKVLPLHVLCCVDLTLGHWPLGYFPFGRCPATWIPNLMKTRATDLKGLRRKPQRFLFHLWHYLVWKQW